MGRRHGRGSLHLLVPSEQPKPRFLLFVGEQLDDWALPEGVVHVPHVTPSSSPSGGSMEMAGDVLYLRWPTVGPIIRTRPKRRATALSGCRSDLGARRAREHQLRETNDRGRNPPSAFV